MEEPEDGSLGVYMVNLSGHGFLRSHITVQAPSPHQARELLEHVLRHDGETMEDGNRAITLAAENVDGFEKPFDPRDFEVSEIPDFCDDCPLENADWPLNLIPTI